MPSVLFPSNLKAWKYRKAFKITEQAGQNLIDYQKLIKIGESSGATGCDFHLEGHSAIFPSGKNQGGDLRITDSDETTLLSFWAENVIGTPPNRVAYVWFKIPSLRANETKTFYIYFGNSSASNASDGNNTFLFFDDFEGTSINTNNWDTSGVTILSYGNSMVNYRSNTNNHRYLMYKLATYSDVAIRAKQKDSNSYPVIGLVARKSTYYGNTIDNLYYTRFYSNTTSSAVPQISKRVNGTEYAIQVDTTGYPVPNVWHIQEFCLAGNNLKHKLIKEDGYQPVGSGEWTVTDTSFTSGYIGLFSEWNDKNIYTDWVLVRKYVSPEPAFYSAGAEEKRSTIIPFII
jgi:hypothetical protein